MITTKHHIVPTSKGGEKSTQSINVIRLNEEKHNRLHALFGNRTYVEQILFLLEYDGHKLSRQKNNDIQEIISLDFTSIYNPGVISKPELLDTPISGIIYLNKKIIRYDENFFSNEIFPENKIKQMTFIANGALKDSFRQKLLNILN